MTHSPTPTQGPDEGGPLLRMVIIRARSSQEVLQLRQMRLDIVRVLPDPNHPPDENSLSGGYIVEAVVPRGMPGKLRALGFDVTEVPGGGGVLTS